MKKYLNAKQATSNENGFSLIEVLMVSAIGVIIMGAMAQLLIGQNKEVNKLVDKLLIADAQRTVTRALTSTDVCSKTLLDASIASFNPTTLPSSIPINRIPYTNDPASAAIITANQALLKSPRIDVASVDLVNISCAQLPCTTTSHSFVGTIRVSFTAPTRSRPLEFPIYFRSSGPPGNQTITGCGTASPVSEHCSPVVSTASTFTNWTQCPSPGEPLQFYCVTDNSVWTGPPGYNGHSLITNHSGQYGNQYDETLSRFRCWSHGTNIKACVRCLN